MKNALKLLLIINIIFILVGCNDNSKKEVNNNIVLQIPKVNENEIGKYYKFSDYLDAKTDPISATKIGYAYSEELKDYDKAIKWYKYSNSMKPTGTNSNYMCYAYQMKKDYETAIKWCKNAIDLGNKEALFQLGTVYEDSKSYKEAILYYKKASKLNNIKAMNNLGYIYNDKIVNLKKAEIWYKKGIKHGNLISYHNISHLYHLDLKDDIKASAYAIALIENKYSKSSVLKLLKNTWNIPNETIKKGYELQLNSDEFPIKFKGKLDLDE